LLIKTKAERTRMTKDQIKRIVLKAIDSVNELLLEENAIHPEPVTILFGRNAVLDSMGFVNFIVALEEMLSDETGVSLNVVEELNAPDNNAPKEATVDQFVEFLFRLVNSK
jgi:acyl carrier protein